MHSSLQGKDYENLGKTKQKIETVLEDNSKLKAKLKKGKMEMSFAKKVRLSAICTILTFTCFLCGYIWRERIGIINFFYVPQLLSILIPLSVTIYYIVSLLDKKEII